ncbi:MAG: hypothetical protein Q9218_003001, partial [Villophora microphyllina]
MFLDLNDYIYDLLKDTSLVETYHSLFLSDLIDIRGNRPSELSLNMTVTVYGNHDLEHALREWATDNNKESPQFGKIRWQLRNPAPILVIQLQRYDYDIKTGSMRK